MWRFRERESVCVCSEIEREGVYMQKDREGVCVCREIERVYIEI